MPAACTFTRACTHARTPAHARTHTCVYCLPSTGFAARKAFCDMKTDAGGWMLMLCYNRNRMNVEGLNDKEVHSVFLFRLRSFDQSLPSCVPMYKRPASFSFHAGLGSKSCLVHRRTHNRTHTLFHEQVPLDPIDPAQCWSHLYLKGFSDAVMRTAFEVRMYCTSSAHDRIMHFKTSEQVRDLLLFYHHSTLRLPNTRRKAHRIDRRMQMTHSAHAN